MKINNLRFVQLQKKPLRNGSLYRVETTGGYVIARLKSELSGFNDEYYVLSQHGTPLLALREEIKLANQSEVNQYLREAR